MKWIGEAPANIALIKYMGKKDMILYKNGSQKFLQYRFLKFLRPKIDDKKINSLDFKLPLKESMQFKQNIPLNSSLSYVLQHLKTKIEIEEEKESQADRFIFKTFRDEPDLSELSKTKFINFFQFLKNVFLIEGNYKITSENNFPHSSGVASSSSSFAALTLASYNLAKDRSKNFKNWNNMHLAQLSSCGSGSSCRSFFSEWCLWNSKELKSISLFPWKNIKHELIIVGKNKKKISSSQAHRLIKTSPHFRGRPQRAEERLRKLLKTFEYKAWSDCYSIVKEEFLDIHNLFKTSSPSFSYQTTESQNILNQLFHFWEKKGDGPLITMDAGPHIHLLYRSDQSDLSIKFRERFLSYPVLIS